MNNQPLVCICIPNYNNEKTISETLDSILNQTYKNIKVKVFDNASTDRSVQIIKEYEKQYSNLEVIINEKNIGGEGNFTKCIQNMEGEFGAVYHSDDVYLATIVEEQVQFLMHNKMCIAVATHANNIDSQSKIIGKRFLPKELESLEEYCFKNEIDLFKMILRYGNFITCPSVMVETKMYKKIHNWNGSDYKTSADLDVWLRLASFGRFGIILHPLINYRLSETSYTYITERARTVEQDMFLVLRSYIENKKISVQLNRNDIFNYKFLIFKDHVNRTINQLIKGEEAHLPLKVFSTEIISTACTSKKNLKIYISGVVCIFLRFFPLPSFVKNLLYSIRY